MPSPKVTEWANCNLRYVAEAKLARLDDADLLELRRLLTAKLGRPTAHLATTGPVAREGTIAEIMDLKKDLSKVAVAEPAKAEPEPPPPPDKDRRVSFVESPHVPHEEHDAQGGGGGDEDEAAADAAADAVAEAAAEALSEDLPEGVTRDQVERVKAFIALKAAAELEPPPPPPPKEDAEPLVVEKHQLRVCSFNALKLRLSNPTGKSYDEDDDDENTVGYKGTADGEQLTRKWLMLAAVMSSYDVIVMQEIPGRDTLCKARMDIFHQLLYEATEEGRNWTSIHSRVSGKDGKTSGAGAEVHAAFVKEPVTMQKWDTLEKVGVTRLDYAPLQLLLHDPRFADPADRNFVLTSVHLPPRDRADARDDQLSALLRHYAAVDTSEYRMQQPFRPNKESKCAPMHIIAGDFNAFPGKLGPDGEELYGLTKAGFVTKIPEGVATTPAGQHYDNFLTPEWCEDTRIVGGGVLQLTSAQNSREGKIGLSDHWPITLTIMEAEKTKAASSASTGKCAAPAPEPPPPPPEAAEAADESPPPPGAAAVAAAPTPAPTALPVPAPSEEPAAEPPPEALANEELPPENLANEEPLCVAPREELATEEPGPAPPCAELASEELDIPAMLDLAAEAQQDAVDRNEPRQAKCWAAAAELLQLEQANPGLLDELPGPPAPSLGEVAASTDPSVQMELASLLMEPVPELTPPAEPTPEPTPGADPP